MKGDLGSGQRKVDGEDPLDDVPALNFHSGDHRLTIPKAGQQNLKRVRTISDMPAPSPIH